MPPDPTAVAQTIPVGYLLVAIGGLCSAISVLLYLLLQAHKDSLALAKEVIPVIVTLMKFLERAERKE